MTREEKEMGKTRKDSKYHHKEQQHQYQQQSQKQADREYKRNQQQEEKKKQKRQKSYEKTSSSSEDIEFNQFLQKEHQLTVMIMRGDGNCLFRSLSHQLSNFTTDYNHMNLRHEIVKYIQDKRDYFQLFFDEDEDGDFNDYLDEMKVFGVWGGHFELYAAAQCLFLSIHVYQWNMPKYVIQCSEENNPLGKPLRIVQVSYHGGCHFNSVVPLTVLSSPLSSKGNGDSEEKKTHIDSVINSSLYVHVNKNVSRSEEEAIETIQNAVPWVSLPAIRLALEWNENNIESSIDLLCTNLESIQVALSQEAREMKEKEKEKEKQSKQQETEKEEEKKYNNNKNTADPSTKNQRFSKTKIKKNNDKQSSNNEESLIKEDTLNSDAASSVKVEAAPLKSLSKKVSMMFPSYK